MIIFSSLQKELSSIIRKYNDYFIISKGITGYNNNDVNDFLNLFKSLMVENNSTLSNLKEQSLAIISQDTNKISKFQNFIRDKFKDMILLENN